MWCNQTPGVVYQNNNVEYINVVFEINHMVVYQNNNVEYINYWQSAVFEINHIVVCCKRCGLVHTLRSLF